MAINSTTHFLCTERSIIVKSFKFVRHLICAILCLVGIVFNFAADLTSSSHIPYVDSEVYGGDAYTGIQNAAAATSNNIRLLSYILDDLCFWLVGITTIMFLMILLKNIDAMVQIAKEEKANPIPSQRKHIKKESTMKKLICVLMLLAMMLSLPSCGCEHNWQKASCKTPKTCTLCGITEGAVADHVWDAATCIKPKTCSVCGKTEGSVSTTHSFSGDKCTACGLVQLTIYNFEDYIDCNATVKVGDSLYYGSSYGYLYTSAECSFEAKGNTHYKYNDVQIVVKFSHYDKAGYQQYLSNSILAILGKPITEEAVPYDDATYTIKLNIAGNGSKTCELSTPWNTEKQAYSDTDALFDRTAYEIVSVSGTVEEYK